MFFFFLLTVLQVKYMYFVRQSFFNFLLAFHFSHFIADTQEYH